MCLVQYQRWAARCRMVCPACPCTSMLLLNAALKSRHVSILCQAWGNQCCRPGHAACALPGGLTSNEAPAHAASSWLSSWLPKHMLAVLQSAGAGRAPPDNTLACLGLSMLFLEAKSRRKNLESAWDDLRSKLAAGFKALFYGTIPFIPLVAIAGEALQFGRLSPAGQVKPGQRHLAMKQPSKILHRWLTAHLWLCCMPALTPKSCQCKTDAACAFHWHLEHGRLAVPISAPLCRSGQLAGATTSAMLRTESLPALHCCRRTASSAPS